MKQKKTEQEKKFDTLLNLFNYDTLKLLLRQDRKEVEFALNNARKFFETLNGGYSEEQIKDAFFHMSEHPESTEWGKKEFSRYIKSISNKNK